LASYYSNQTLSWYTLYTGLGSLSYNLNLDEDYEYVGSTTEVTYHQALAKYYAKTYAYDLYIRLTNSYYNSDGSYINGVPYTKWGSYKYAYIWNGDTVSGGGNYSIMYSKSGNRVKVNNTVAAVGYGDGGYISLDSNSITVYIN